MKTIKTVGALAGICAMLLMAACPVPETELMSEAVSSFAILKNGVSIGYNYEKPFFEILEEKSVILGVQMNPDVKAGINWQSSRDIVDLSEFFAPEIVLFARYGGETNIDMRVANVYNEVPVRAIIRVDVIPTSYYKWDYQLDGWKDMPPLTPYTVDRIYNHTLMRSGNSPINEDIARGGFVMEGPSTLVVGSVMATSTNSPYQEDPLTDDTAQFDFSQAPSKLPELYTGRIKVSVDYAILEEPAIRQGLRLQVNNNTEERDKASAITNWLVAEYTSALPRSGILSGVFDTAELAFDLSLDADKLDRIPMVPSPTEAELTAAAQLPADEYAAWKDARQKTGALAYSFVCLAVPDGKVLIRSIRIETAD